MTIYYTYYSYEEFGRGYIGYRKCPEKCTPETDSYMGSFTDKTFKPTHKVILGIYTNKERAIADETFLHKAYDVAKNPHFANKARQTSTKFCCDSEESRKKISKKLTGKKRGPLSLETKNKLSEIHRGKKLSASHRTKIAEANRKRKYYPVSEEVKKRISEKVRGKKNSVEAQEKWHKAMRARAKRYNWINVKTDVIHYNKSVIELCDIYSEILYGSLHKVARGKRSHYKGWKVMI